MKKLIPAALAALLALAGACKKDSFIRVLVERGDVTGDVYRYRVASTLDGVSGDTLLFPLDPPANALPFPYDVVLGFVDGKEGSLTIAIEALRQDGSTVAGVASLTLPVPERGVDDVTVTLAAPTDADGDMVPDALDNCPDDANANQMDCDTDGEGDVCDSDCPCCLPDTDGDAIPDVDDNCDDAPNPLQEDTVPAAGPDGVGDACGDFDTDGSLDPDDCEPENLAVFPGNADLCDGADADCVPAVCAFDLAGLEVYDLAVSSADRVAFTIDGTGGAGVGALRTFDGTDPVAATVAMTDAPIGDPRGMAVNVAPEHLVAAPDLFYVTDPTAGLLRDYDATGGTVFAGYPLSAAGTALAASPFGELAFAPLGTMNHVVVFDPCETPGMAADCYEQAGNTTNIDPVTLDLTLAPPTPPPDPGLGLDTSWRVRAMAMRPGTVIDFPHLAYMIFDDQPAVVGLSVNPMTLEASAGASGLVPMTGTAPATALFYDATNDDLLVTFGDAATDGELRVFAANGVTSMTALLSTTPVPGAGVPSCPSGVALGTDASTLWVADACNDVVWEGTKSADGMTVTFDTAHPVCAAPSRLGVVGAPGGDVVYVGCAGALGVVGSD